jgi:hypothetical protein
LEIVQTKLARNSLHFKTKTTHHREEEEEEEEEKASKQKHNHVKKDEHEC